MGRGLGFGEGAVGAVDSVGAGVGVPKTALGDGIPFGGGAGEGDGGEAGATGERTYFDTRHAVGNGDALKELPAVEYKS